MTELVRRTWALWCDLWPILAMLGIGALAILYAIALDRVTQ